MSILFLTVDEVERLHTLQVTAHGGSAGIRDVGLLQSALSMSSAGFGGQFLHEFPHEMAAAYLFHIAANHPFFDGNKRTALAAALLFLTINGLRLGAGKDATYALTLGVAAGEIDKPAVVTFFREYVRPA